MSGTWRQEDSSKGLDTMPLVPSAVTFSNPVLPTQCIYVLYGSQNKQRLFPCTALT